jgi:uncharacterized protein (DUF934 family)
MKIIRDREIVDDDWVHVAGDAELPAKPIVTLARYTTGPDDLLRKVPALGVRVGSDKLPTDIPELTRLALVAIEFPRFTDGRGYSIARQLRDRYQFRGELRAVGWVLRDQLFYLWRCGFNAFEVQPGKSLESALEAFGDFSVKYQAAADEKRPIYRRR